MFWEIFACVVAAALLWQVHVIASRHRLIARAIQEQSPALRSMVTALHDIRTDIRSLPDRETALADAIREFSEASISEPSRALAKWIATEGQRHTSLLESQQANRERERELLTRWREQVGDLKQQQAELHEYIRMWREANMQPSIYEGGTCETHGEYRGFRCVQRADDKLREHLRGGKSCVSSGANAERVVKKEAGDAE